MADESLQDKTEAATPRRREDSRRKGEVPKSQEMGSALLMLGAAVLVRIRGDDTVVGLGTLMEMSMRGAALPPLGVDATAAWLRTMLLYGVSTIAPLLLGLAGVGFAVAAMQGRGTLSLQPLTPKWERLSPQKNIARLVSPRTLVELLKALLKLAIIAGVIYVSLSRAWDELIVLPQQSTLALGPLVGRYAGRVLTLAGFAMLALALADYAWQSWQHEKKLRMTKEEVKRESKESDGDPLVRARMRSVGRALARVRMLRDVGTATVVITNPTHIAIALRYDPDIAPAPIVIAMGRRKLAEQIRRIATESGVPLVENRPLARALIASAHVGSPIPAELYVAVAEVLAYVFGQRQQTMPTVDLLAD